MKKSIPGFVLGLIGSLFALWWGFVCGLGGDLVNAVGSAVSGESGMLTPLSILGWLAFIGAILGIVGASMCFKNSKKGGVFLAIATVFSGALQIYIFVNALAAGEMITTLIFIFLLPVILLAIGTVFAFTSKTDAAPAVTNGANQYGPSDVSGNANVNRYSNAYGAAPQARQEKSLEEELSALKSMLDKGLLTEEEYASAKKSAIDKHLR